MASVIHIDNLLSIDKLKPLDPDLLEKLVNASTFSSIVSSYTFCSSDQLHVQIFQPFILPRALPPAKSIGSFA